MGVSSSTNTGVNTTSTSSRFEERQNLLNLALISSLTESRGLFIVCAAKVCVPRCVNGGGVLLPGGKHLVDVVGVASIKEAFMVRHGANLRHGLHGGGALADG